jgi:pre-rRNA-processing protein TSR3
MLLSTYHILNSIDPPLKICVYMFGQDDPKKCTAAKLVRFGLAKQVRHITHKTVLLNPLSTETLSKQTCTTCDSVCAVDCSWEKAAYILTRQRGLRQGKQRRLPAMLAANPTNYAKIGRLSSAEALAGSLFLLGHEDKASELLNKFKWGPTFLKLNNDLLNDYLNADSVESILETEREYFGHLY